MQRAAMAVPGGMVSLLGADEDTVGDLCERARGDEVLAPSNFNCPGQIVISGSQAACRRAIALADAVGGRAVALKVAGAFHSPLMAPAAAELMEALRQTPFTTPRIPVVANVDAAYHKSPETIPDSLARQLTHPVLWQRCVERMIEDGVREFVEIGPGRVLTGLVRKINREVSAVNISTAEALSSALAV
jgi:[acyl-carrier-protein] S-malonyltransferase